MKWQLLFSLGILLILSTVIAQPSKAQLNFDTANANEIQSVQPGFWPGYTVRVQLIAEELGLDEETTNNLVSLAETHQTEMEKLWVANGPGPWQWDQDAQQAFISLQLKLNDQIRELIGDETYIQWQTMWRTGFGPRNMGPGYFAGPGYNMGAGCYYRGFGAGMVPRRQRSYGRRRSWR